MSDVGPDPQHQPDAPQETAASETSGAPRHRTHPITPLVTGWKIVVGLIAVFTAQNVARLVEDFTVQRALIGLGVLAAVIVIAIILSALSWWFTSYAVDEHGVSLHTGMISRSQQYAPRARIESVSVERPLLARLLGLAKVRIEVAGGGESYLDIQYLTSARAEELRLGILSVAAGARSGTTDEEPDAPAPVLAGTEGATDPASTGAEDGAGAPVEAPAADGAGRLESLLYDGVTDGELIAKIPTERLVRSLLRDLEFLLGVAGSVLGVVVAVGLVIWQDGISPAIILPLLPALIAVPKYIFGRIESGWGFVSRITERGLRMRRGLATTRTDNIAAGRIQFVELRRPLLWRTPGWTAASVTVAGIEDDSADGATAVLPVGTREELRSTLGHLTAPLGSEDDLALLEHLLTVPAPTIDGLRTPVRWYWIARRTRVTLLLPGAVVHRSGILSKKLRILPRERIQQLALEDDPFGRRLGILDLKASVAGTDLRLEALSRADALALHAVLVRDARILRRYRDREHWPRPVLARPRAEEPT